VDIFRNPNFNIIGRRRTFLAISGLMLIISLGAMLYRYSRTGDPVPLGVDFKGGTLVYLKMAERPNPDALRDAMAKAGLQDVRIQRYGPEQNNEVLIAMEQGAGTEEALVQGRAAMLGALQKDLPQDKRDLNNVGPPTIAEYLLQADPLRAGTDANQRYLQIAQQIANFRDTQRGGLLRSFDELRGVVPPPVVDSIQQGFVVGKFAVRNVEIVGPQVGSQLRKQAILASLYSLAGMLIYLSLRFEVIYGAAAVLAVFHDVLITLGLFSLLKVEVSLTVIASLLTLMGYSMNDKIVIFDRVRENLKILRREPIGSLVNRSINQTLNRTMLTAGPTFLTLLALLIFGGEVLFGFALALVVGIAVGTYSSFGFAAPLLVIYQEWRAKGTRPPVSAPAAASSSRAGARAK
jgi:preprotein translocase subunit SecF